MPSHALTEVIDATSADSISVANWQPRRGTTGALGATSLWRASIT